MASPWWCVTKITNQDAPIDKSPSACGGQICAVLHRTYWKNMLNFPFFPEVTTHHPRLSSPHVFLFLYCNRGSSYQNHLPLTLGPLFLFLIIWIYSHHPITSIINTSLEQDKCPNFFKQVHVTPILKKSSLNKTIFKKFRLVSNLNFISQILERVVAVQLQTHLDEAGLMTAFQSAYRKHHSTESALLNIHNDILFNIAKGLSQPLPFWISPPHSIPLTTTSVPMTSTYTWHSHQQNSLTQYKN